MANKANARFEVRHLPGASPQEQVQAVRRAVFRLNKAVGKAGVLAEYSARTRYETPKERAVRKRKAKSRARGVQ